jgi:hypothetical protein
VNCSLAQGQEVVAHISYTEIHDRTSPFAEVTSTAVWTDIRLQRDGAVLEDEARKSGRASGHHSKSLKLGGNSHTRWKVAGPHELINIVDYISYRRAILVTVHGQSCTAQVDYKLKPGFTDYRYHRLKTGEVASARSVKATGLSCSIR